MVKLTIAEYRVRAADADASYPGVPIDEIVTTLNASDETALSEFDESMLRRELARLRRLDPEKASVFVERASAQVEQLTAVRLERATRLGLPVDRLGVGPRPARNA